MKLATAQISYVGNSHQLVLDTTFKTGSGIGATLAPTKELVYAHKYHGGSWESYTRGYFRILADRAPYHRQEWESLITEERTVVIKCYCNSDMKPHCHRYLLVEVFENLCKRRGIPFEYIGEIR